MARVLRVAAAQMGPIARRETRKEVVERLRALMAAAHKEKCRLVVFTELALTTFFPRWYMTDQAEVDHFFEREMPGPETRPLFDDAARLGIGFCLGYGELVHEGGTLHHYNTSILVDERGVIVGKYRKIHLPGHAEHDPQRAFQHLEKRYFEPGNLGFPVWRTMGGLIGMCICNDRRWPETYRVMGLQGVEMVLLGFNTPSLNAVAREAPHLRMLHHLVPMQAGAYQNGTWVVAVAKCGTEEGVHHMGGTVIIAPTGEVVAEAKTEADEILVHDCDLDRGRYIKDTIFNFAAHRRIEHYGLIASQVGEKPPP
ncbi:MAG: N-carbamoyl-D-amino-acid hydrolase [Alphaproteobacteria bacterium]